MDMSVVWAGYGPVIDLAKDPKNTELVEEVKLPSLRKSFPVFPGMLTVGPVILTVLESRFLGQWCLPWTRVSTLY